MMANSNRAKASIKRVEIPKIAGSFPNRELKPKSGKQRFSRVHPKVINAKVIMRLVSL